MNFLKTVAACSVAIMGIDLVGNILANIRAKRDADEVLRIMCESLGEWIGTK